MSHCWICKEPLLKGQTLAVLAFPIECTHTGGDYSFLGDFTENEKVVHCECFKKNPKAIIDIFSDITPSNETTKVMEPVLVSTIAEPPSDKAALPRKLYQSLKDLGENVTYQEVSVFMKDSESYDLSGLIEDWFQRRNKFA